MPSLVLLISSFAPLLNASGPPLHTCGQGMKLGGASKGKTMLESLIKEDHLVSIPKPTKAQAGAEPAVTAAVVAASVHPVTLSVEERLSCQVRSMINYTLVSVRIWCMVDSSLDRHLRTIALRV